MASWYIKPQSLPPRWRSALTRRLRGLAGIRLRGGYGRRSASTGTSLWTGTCLTRPTREACSFSPPPGTASAAAVMPETIRHGSSFTAPITSGSVTVDHGESGAQRVHVASGDWLRRTTFDVYSDDNGKTWRDRETGAVVDPDAEWERVIVRRRDADEWDTWGWITPPRDVT